jgi:nucleoside-diphosphate-sugar epimerase
VDGLQHVLDRLAGRFDRLIFTSSTGVYGQTDGGWVDELAPTEPTSDSGRIVLEAEQLLQSDRAVILRLAGLYGPTRLLRADALRRGEPIPGDPDHWLNLVHLDDATSAVLACTLAPTLPHSLYNVADGHPLPRRAFYEALARHLGTPPPRFESTPSRSGRDLAHKRINASRFRRDLAFSPRYPDSTTSLSTWL